MQRLLSLRSARYTETMPRAPERLVLALDIGSSSTRSALFDESGIRLEQTAASREYVVEYGADGAAVLDPRKLYRAVRSCVRETLEARNTGIAAVSASAFWHGLLGLDGQSQPITPIYMWGDSRAAADARRLRQRVDEREVHARTGCMLRAPFWPAKLLWLRRTQPALFRRVQFWISPADWIFSQIFAASGTSISMASATGLFDVDRREWDEELCRRCGIARSALSPVRTLSAARWKNAQVFTPIGDGAASNLGSGADRAGVFAINIGTSAAVRVICARGRTRVPFGLFRYLLDEEREVIGGAISNAGNLRRWCLRELHLNEERSSVLRRGDRIAAAKSDVDVLPFWVTERAPDWPENARGVIAGLTQATTGLEIERAAQCSAFYRLAEILERTERATTRARVVVVSGGILRAPAVLALLADAIGRDLAVARERESSLRGAAIYALEKFGCMRAPSARSRQIKHDAQLADLHLKRRARQETLERTLSSPG